MIDKLHTIVNNPRLAALVSELLPDVGNHTAIAAQAAVSIQKRTADLIHDPRTPDPFSPGDVEKWAAAEAKRHGAAEQRAAEVTVLRELRDRVATASRQSLAGGGIDTLIAGLHDQLAEQWSHIADLVDDMDSIAGSPVASITDAVNAGCADQWRQLCELLPTVADIRNAQTVLYSAGGVLDELDRVRLGDVSTAVNPDARLYFHANLDSFAPDWRMSDGALWPYDAAERAVWLIHSRSGAWVPTAKQLREQLHSPDPDVADMVVYQADTFTSVTNVRGVDPMNNGFATGSPRGRRPVDILAETKTIRRPPRSGRDHGTQLPPAARRSAFSARVQSAAAYVPQDDDD